MESGKWEGWRKKFYAYKVAECKISFHLGDAQEIELLLPQTAKRVRFEGNHLFQAFKVSPHFGVSESSRSLPQMSDNNSQHIIINTEGVDFD